MSREIHVYLSIAWMGAYHITTLEIQLLGSKFPFFFPYPPEGVLYDTLEYPVYRTAP
jgi:hypothetical protein